jgi:hypothetical protein
MTAETINQFKMLSIELNVLLAKQDNFIQKLSAWLVKPYKKVINEKQIDSLKDYILQIAESSEQLEVILKSKCETLNNIYQGEIFKVARLVNIYKLQQEIVNQKVDYLQPDYTCEVMYFKIAWCNAANYCDMKDSTVTKCVYTLANDLKSIVPGALTYDLEANLKKLIVNLAERNESYRWLCQIENNKIPVFASIYEIYNQNDFIIRLEQQAEFCAKYYEIRQ